ncbi:MAG: C40 family peptidase [Dermatophilus congolensis]|nr:C40 family peptidase [Dermatophilus congolensis]
MPKPAPERNKAAPKPRATPAPKTAEQKASSGVVGIASGLQGIPYVWGGTSTKGFDCSGFTQHVYGKAGITLPRTAAQQQRATKKVSDPKPGDLVFFGSPAYHVGVYAGEGRMYDAPRRGKTTGLRTIWSSNVTYGRAA